MDIQAIDQCLPQTQCKRCTYSCCHDYAAAIALGEAKINQCPPGGSVTINKLAALTGQKSRPLAQQFGKYQIKTWAYINENKCIGCVLCIQVCPVDAIIGTNKYMHTVIQSHCTGCELCLPVCPTDCIEMQATLANIDNVIAEPSDWPGYSTDDISLARFHYKRRQKRLSNQDSVKTIVKALDNDARQLAILDAVKRRQQRI